jgi:hypothetical protein
MGKPRIFKTKWFQRCARKEQIDDGTLLEAVTRAEKGLIDANRGGGVIKQRIARPGQGKSGGYRTVIVFRHEHRAVFTYGFAKSERANIERDEEKEFKVAAKHILAVTEKQLAEIVSRGDFVEVKNA